MTFAWQIKSIVDRVRTRCEAFGSNAAALLDEFLEPLRELERCDDSSQVSLMRLISDRCVSKTLETLYACRVGSKRHRDRVRVMVNRSKLSGDVKQCRLSMQAALDLFNVRSSSLLPIYLHILNCLV